MSPHDFKIILNFITCKTPHVAALLLLITSSAESQSRYCNHSTFKIKVIRQQHTMKHATHAFPESCSQTYRARFSNKGNHFSLLPLSLDEVQYIKNRSNLNPQSHTPPTSFCTEPSSVDSATSIALLLDCKRFFFSPGFLLLARGRAFHLTVR
jgi:hypothetical protein